MKFYVVGRAAQRKLLALALVLMVCGGCAEPAAGPAATPSPTIAVPPTRPSPTPPAPAVPATRAPAQLSPSATPPTARPSATPPPTAQPSAPPPAGSPAPAAPTAPPAPFAYMWPTYLPAAMRVSPGETRVAREDEIGQNSQGFFIVTFTDGTGKLVIGGGATETLPLAGEQRHISVGGREATLTTNGEQRQVVFAATSGSLFVYSSQLSEEELLRVAGSLQPIDVQDLRALVVAG